MIRLAFLLHAPRVLSCPFWGGGSFRMPRLITIVLCALCVPSDQPSHLGRVRRGHEVRGAFNRGKFRSADAFAEERICALDRWMA